VIKPQAGAGATTGSRARSRHTIHQLTASRHPLIEALLQAGFLPEVGAA
jgi:hypothetical protein